MKNQTKLYVCIGNLGVNKKESSIRNGSERAEKRVKDGFSKFKQGVEWPPGTAFAASRRLTTSTPRRTLVQESSKTDEIKPFSRKRSKDHKKS